MKECHGKGNEENHVYKKTTKYMRIRRPVDSPEARLRILTQVRARDLLFIYHKA